MKGRRKIKKYFLASILCIAIAAVQIFAVPVNAEAAGDRTFLLPQARKLALSNSSDYKKKYNEIILKNMKYEGAVRSVNEKMRDLRTFRWTPLLKFHFPEKPNLSQTMEFILKPAGIQVEIDNLRHGLTDMKYEIQEKTDLAYAECYAGQEQTAFTESLLEEAKEELKKNQYRLAMGNASQNDIAVMEKSIKTKTSELSLQKRNFETAKKKLSDLTGMDVTTGYRFKNPFQTADIPREHLEDLISSTLANDQSYYEAKAAAALDRRNLETAEQYMKSWYGGKMNRIASYVSLAKQGKDVDSAAFQIAYNGLLEAVDKPWQGKKKILFIKIPREWFKGKLDGIRYVEDEPMALYTACMDYISAAKDVTDLEKGIRSEVEGSYETIVTAKNAYEALKESAAEMKADLDRLQLLNMQGKAEYSEVKDKKADYEEAQMETLSALKDYNDLLCSLDRLTCGAVTKYLMGEAVSIEGSGTANSLFSVEEEDYPYYYIETRVEDMKFVFGIHIPDDFEPEITEFELWYGDILVGPRTDSNKQLSHLAIASKNDESRFTVRLFKNGKFLEQCEIDPTVLKDRLNLKAAAREEKEVEKVVASYQITLNQELSLASISLSPEDADIRYYSFVDKNGNALYTEQLAEISDSFTYLSVMAKDLKTIRVRLYGSDKEMIYDGYFDTGRQTVMAAVMQ